MGAKRSLLVDANGIPLGLVIDGANRHDKKLVEATLESIPIHRDLPQDGEEQGLCLDKGYDDDDIRALVAEFAFTAHIRARGEEAQALKREAGFKARRWVVERTHSWMNRFRLIGALPAMAFLALATCSAIPRRVRRARSARYW